MVPGEKGARWRVGLDNFVPGHISILIGAVGGGGNLNFSGGGKIESSTKQMEQVLAVENQHELWSPQEVIGSIMVEENVDYIEGENPRYRRS